MNTSLILTPDRKNILDKLISDLKYALKDLSKEELIQVLSDSSLVAIKTTYNKKKVALKNAGSFIKKTYDRYKVNGLNFSLQSDAQKFGIFLSSLPTKTKNIYNAFLGLSREEQYEVIIVTILTIAIFFAAGGGADMEGGIPDSDIALMGIDDHRNIVTHSILIGLGIEFVGRFSLLILEKVKNRMPANRHIIWDKVYGYIDNHKEKAISAMWLGIGTHLLKDSGIFGHGVTAYKDLPFSMPIEGHQGLFAANGTVSGLFGSVK